MNWVLVTVRLLLPTLLVLIVGCGNDPSFDLAKQTDDQQSTLKINDEVDVLWVIDNSSSMAKHQQALADQMGLFVDALDQTKLNFHIAVTTTDMRTPPRGAQGEFIGDSDDRVLKRGSSNLVSTLTNRMLNIGQGGSPVEQGLGALKEALSADKLQFQNAGFLREKSLLVVIFLTNEDDQSVNDDYIAFLDSIKPPLPSGERSWVAHFIGVLPNDSSCSTFNGDYQPGLKYLELVQESNGVAENICSADLRSALNAVKSRVIEFVTDFYLEREPKVESIKVYVNGAEVPQDANNGWTYIEELNAIRFHGDSIPKADAKVRIDYDPAGIKN